MGKIKDMKVYVLIGYIPHSVDNEVEVIDVFYSEKGAEKGWEEYSEENEYFQEYEIKEFDVRWMKKEMILKKWMVI